MKKLVAIRTPRTEDEARFVAFVDPSFGDMSENINYPLPKDRSYPTYRLSAEIFSFSMRGDRVIRGGRILDHALHIRKNEVTYDREDEWERPDAEMYFLTSIALKNSGMKFNKKKGEMMYVKNKSNSRPSF